MALSPSRRCWQLQSLVVAAVLLAPSAFATAGVLSADELGRQMMQPGEPVFSAIVAHFGPEVLTSAGVLDRAALAKLSFVDGRLAELNAIVHPAVLARQEVLAAQVAAHTPDAVLLIESALLFETEHAGVDGWKSRFDRILLVTSSEQNKIRRFVDRTATLSRESSEEREADARRRLARQIGDAEKSRWVDFVLCNDGSLADLEQQVRLLWPRLLAEAATASAKSGLA